MYAAIHLVAPFQLRMFNIDDDDDLYCRSKQQGRSVLIGKLFGKRRRRRRRVSSSELHMYVLKTIETLSERSATAIERDAACSVYIHSRPRYE